MAVYVTWPSEKSDYREALTPPLVGGSKNPVPHSTSEGNAFVS